MLLIAVEHLDLELAIIRKPLIISPETSVMEVITNMSGALGSCCSSNKANSHLNALHLEVCSSCVLVVNNDQLLGIFTERDVVRLSAEKASLDKIRISEVMTQPVVTLHQAKFTDSCIAANLFRKYHITHLPVLDNDDRILGLLTHASLQQLTSPVDLLPWRLVADVMSVNTICRTPDTSIIAITRLMAEHRVSSVVIIEKPSQEPAETLRYLPVGIVTERDIVQFQALDLDFDWLQVQSVMSTPVFSVSPKDTLWGALQMMQQHFVRHLVVTDDQGCLVGVITQTSILKILNPLTMCALVDVLENKVSQLEAEKLELLQNRNAQLEQQIQERTATLKAKAEQEELITKIASQIRSSLNLPNILATTVEQVRSILNCDRADIWKIQPDLSTIVVAESIKEERFSNWGKQICDCCFVDNPFNSNVGRKMRAVSDIYTETISDCHRELLESLQIRSKILVPILQGDTLWGLLSAVESQAARQWNIEEVTLLEQLATHLEIAIGQATAYEQIQNELVERQQTEARLRETEQRYAILAATVPVGIFRVDVHGNSIYVNQRCCEILGRTPETLAGTGWQEALHPDDRQKVVAETERTRHENLPFRQEYRILRPEGTVVWVFGQTEAERDAQGQITGYIGTLTDISDRKRSEKSLQQLNQELEANVAERTAALVETNLQLARATRLKDEFLANMSHELRTPLNAILGMAEALQEQVFGGIGELQRRALQTIERSGNHLLELINDILDVAKVEAGQFELQCTPTAIYPLCQSSLAFVKQQALKKRIQIEMRISPHLPDLLIDERRIRQVLINLLNNAVKFTPEGGSITLEVTLPPRADSISPGVLRIAVIDTGIGIAAENLDKLFQPFIQIDSALNRQYTGTGLGLSLVKRIVEMHGGSVGVSSQEGVGSCFTIDLPCGELNSPRFKPASSAPTHSDSSIVSVPIGRPPLILLAEDNEANIRTIASYLAAKGYRIILAKNGREAIDLAKAEMPDLILMDIQMPEMDGLEAIKQIRGDLQLVEIPIIALTALAMPGDRERCLATGANEYLAKPVKLKQLTSDIEQLLATKKRS